MGVRSLTLGLVGLSACGFPMPAPFGNDGGADSNRDVTDSAVAHHTLTDPTNWAKFDTLMLLQAPRGFVGAAFDGQNLYLAPFEQVAAVDGVAVTLDTTRPFTNPNSWASFDLTSIDVNLKGFIGAIREPSGIELVPFGASKPVAARYVGGPGVTNFTDPTMWQTFDLTKVPTSQAGFLGGAYDGHQYVYYSGGINPSPPGGHDGTVLRYDTTGAFGNPLQWKAYDYATQAPDPAAVGFAGAIIDRNGFVYFIPHHDNSATQNGSELLVYDSSKPFDLLSSYTAIDLPTVTGSGDAVDFGGAGFDGTYLYLPPYRNDLTGIVARYDTRVGDVTNTAAWKTYPTGRLAGFDLQSGDDIFFGVAVDGRYVYFLPYQSSKLLRVDTAAPDFTQDSAWEIFDLSSLGFGSVDGYESAVYDGQYLYLIPNPTHSVVLRFDATDPQALSNVYPGFTGSFL